MSGEAGALARRFLEAFDTGDESILDQVLDPGYRSLTRPFPGTDATREGAKRQLRLLRGAFPDARFTAEEVFGRDDRVYLRWTMTGTHLGEILGVPPTGKRVAHYGQEFLRVRGGRIVERQGQEDHAEFEHKLRAAGGPQEHPAAGPGGPALQPGGERCLS